MGVLNVTVPIGLVTPSGMFVGISWKGLKPFTGVTGVVVVLSGPRVTLNPIPFTDIHSVIDNAMVVLTDEVERLTAELAQQESQNQRDIPILTRYFVYSAPLAGLDELDEVRQQAVA